MRVQIVEALEELKFGRLGSAHVGKSEEFLAMKGAMTALKTAIAFDEQAIARFCQTWQITEFALFGSVLTDEFGDDSDIDVLVTFEEPTRWSLFDVVDMKDELERQFGRKVDFVEKAAIRNPWRRRSILGSYRVIYAA